MKGSPTAVPNSLPRSLRPWSTAGSSATHHPVFPATSLARPGETVTAGLPPRTETVTAAPPSRSVPPSATPSRLASRALSTALPGGVPATPYTATWPCGLCHTPAIISAPVQPFGRVMSLGGPSETSAPAALS